MYYNIWLAKKIDKLWTSIEHLYQYYCKKIITFTNTADELIMQKQILIKHKTKLYQLYLLILVPVHIDTETY